MMMMLIALTSFPAEEVEKCNELVAFDRVPFLRNRLNTKLVIAYCSHSSYYAHWSPKST